jgi:hypothetical protein
MFKYVFLLILFSISASAQEKKEEIIAKAGNIEITETEFLERYQLNPQLTIHRKGEGDANKQLLLYGILAEKLLALDAIENKLDTPYVVKFYLKNFEKMFVRDELYRKEVKQKSKDHAESLLSFYLENSSRIFTKTIISKDESGINKIYSILNQGVPFDTIFAELTPAERDTITLYSGTLDRSTEEQLFSLPEKAFSKPINYNGHFVIFYIEAKNDPVLAKSMGWEQEYKRLEKAAAERAEGIFYKK